MRHLHSKRGPMPCAIHPHSKALQVASYLSTDPAQALIKLRVVALLGTLLVGACRAGEENSGGSKFGFEGWQVLSGFSFGGVGFSLGLSVSGEVGLGAGADKRANPFLCEPGQKV